MAKHMRKPVVEQKKKVPWIAVVIAVIAIAGVAAGVFLLLPKEGAAVKGGATEGDEESVGIELAEDPEDAEEEPASEFARMLRDHEVHSIRLIGDSITAGFGTDGYEDANLAGEGKVIFNNGAGEVYYETPASVDCWANAFRSYAAQQGVTDFVNAGINGSFMTRLSDTPDAWLDGGADVVFVALGTNDAGYVGPDEFRATAQKGLAAAAEKSKLVVVLAPVRDLRPESMLVEPASELGDILAQLCEQNGYVFVDPRDAVTADMFNSDGLHPNSQGSHAIWTCIQQTLGL